MNSKAKKIQETTEDIPQKLPVLFLKKSESSRKLSKISAMELRSMLMMKRIFPGKEQLLLFPSAMRTVRLSMNCR